MKLITGIVNGRPENLDQFFENCKYFEGKKVDITIERHKTKATYPQKKYSFGVVFKKISDYMKSYGDEHTPKELYEFYKSKGYFGYKEIMGEQVPKGLSEATTLEASEAKEKIQREWANRGLVIPDPNQEDFL
jgi:hypothetical protein